MLKIIARRINWVFLFSFFLGGSLLARLFFLQIISGGYYQSVASRQRNYSAVLEPRRGNIYFQNKSGELITAAGTKEGYDIYINPRLLNETNADAEALYKKLEVIFPLKADQPLAEKLDREYFFNRLKRINDPFEIIVKNVEEEKAVLVRDLKIDGVGLAPTEWRYYPAGKTASHVLGFLGYNGDQLEGRYGIEQYFEEVIKGKKGYIEGEKSAQGFLIDLGKKILNLPQEGQDVVLTINIDVQLFLEETLGKTRQKWRAKSAAGIIIEPRTGKVLAMASQPDFDPNKYGEAEDLSVFVNPLVERIYEFGSVFKPLTMAAALDKGVITPETKYYDRGYLILNNRRIENYDGKGRGEVDMQKVLEESLNTGAVFAMQKLGKENFYDYMQKYGFDFQTDIELPGEAVGNLSNLDTSRDIEYATASYGQGIAVSPLAVTRAFGVLANGGNLIKPYIVERIIKSGRLDYAAEPKLQSRAISEGTAETISRMLVKVVDDALLGGTLKNPRYTIAAKTGTAFIPKKDSPGYSDESLHSFFGYAPGFDAKFLIFLFLEKPQEVRYASQSLAESFMKIMDFLFDYYAVPPDR
ncbi:MAG: penicillin-binding protein 2 [Candidatus Niyogibacteria bacterium]|nr:penicillin-binding protein 2 [Candidatus Niyogibacteria bacterium]